MLIDSHAHLNFPELMADIEGVLARARKAGVEKIINIGTNLEDSKIAIDLAQKYDNLYATVGIHPDSPSPSATDWSELEKLAKNPKVVAIGECGLDYSRIKYDVSSIKYHNETERQRRHFQKQIEIAKNLELPMSIHIRDAQNDLMAILDAARMTGRAKGVFHCFSGDQKYLEFVLEQGFFVSFAGNVTFKNAQNLRDLAKATPLDRLLLETDCPYLSPEPLRGSQNEPANVKITVAKLAEIKNMSLDHISSIILDNTRRLFNI